MSNWKRIWIAFPLALLIAFLSWISPTRRMPLDYDAIIWRSIPYAAAWVLLFGFSLYRFKKRGLWLLLGAPMALYWPIWLIFNHFPDCYYIGNCQ
jgi:hypothetical protein